MRRAARQDYPQKAIIDRLRSIGVSVEIIGKPVDLLVCCRGRTALLEVKNADDPRLTTAQVEFIARWPGEIHVVMTPDEAVKALCPELLT